MKPYRLKHKPSGFYYSPGKRNLNTRGKIYQTRNNPINRCLCLRESYNNEYYDFFTVYIRVNSKVHKACMDLGMTFEDVKYGIYTVKTVTNVSDWEIEEV